jgi:hypothetical protein
VLPLWPNSIDVDARPPPLDPPGKPAAPPNPVAPCCGRRRTAARSHSARAIAPPTSWRTSVTATEDRPVFPRERVCAHGPVICAEGMCCLGVPFQWWERIALPRLVR